jgi:hypothetical protein
MPVRDQQESRFTAILTQLMGRIPGARAAAVVDAEGETVDYAGELDPYFIRVTAAHLRIVLAQVHARCSAAAPLSVELRAAKASFLALALPDGYALAIVLSRQAKWPISRRPLAACARALAHEAGWSVDGWPSGQGWYVADVLADRLGRPSALRTANGLEALEVIGRCTTGLGARERGWRVRAASGVEAMAVRDAGGFWYLDVDPDTSPRSS